MTPLRAIAPVAIAEAWNACVPRRYRIDGRLVAQNLLESALLHDAASRWNEGTFVAIKRSAAEVYEGPDTKTAHLSLLGKAPDRALAGAVGVLRDEGYETLVVGTDSGHFLPGAPTDVPWLGQWLQTHGFVPGGLAFDLERDLRGFQHELPPARSERFRPLGPDDRSLLEDFLLREFPGRWRYDTLRKFDAEGPDAVYGLFIDDRCEGFALLQIDGCRIPIGGAVWRRDLGAGWGALGPIGVASSLRGQGLGSELLARSLDDLARRVVRRAIIDWTGLIDFYGAQGFSVTRAYRSYRLDLAADR